MPLCQAYREEWSASHKLLFRLISSYLILYIVLMFIGPLFEATFISIGKNILGISYDFEANGRGSGDTTYAYVTLFVNIVLAIVFTAVWSLLQKKKKAYNKEFYWFLVIIRIFVIAAMLLYGFVKVFQIQFRPASFVRLLQPLGEFSPMGLAWQYMGYSKGFALFAGLMEIVGGILLIWRRTATLGSFIVIGVMTQVAMMNLMFDIPVKLFSLHLVLMGLVIFLTDIKRFLKVFIRNESVDTYQFYYPNNSKNYQKTISLTKKIVLPILLIVAGVLGYVVQLNVSDVNHKPELHGIWKVETFVKNSDTIPPLITDKNRWHYLIIERKKRAVVKTMTNEIKSYSFVTDTSAQKISVSLENSPKDSLNVTYHITSNDSLVLSGKLEKDSILIQFSRIYVDSFPLKSRGFHWINEYPANW